MKSEQAVLPNPCLEEEEEDVSTVLLRLQEGSFKFVGFWTSDNRFPFNGHWFFNQQF
jgi:hypothetical protein